MSTERTVGCNYERGIRNFYQQDCDGRARLDGQVKGRGFRRQLKLAFRLPSRLCATARLEEGGALSALWHYCETGSGRPLILLHGLGMSHTVWRAVMPYLSPTRRVIAFDIAGFGSTPPLGRSLCPTTQNLVDSLEHSVRQLGLDGPVDFAGNSLGGLLALEAARRGIARSVVAISPAGLWQAHPPRHVKYVFVALKFAATNFTNAAKAAMRFGVLRELLLAVPISVGSRHMSSIDAMGAIDDLAAAESFYETFKSTRAPFSGGTSITVPVTIAFGDRDLILPNWSRSRQALP